jgi:hypothetical protein
MLRIALGEAAVEAASAHGLQGRGVHLFSFFFLLSLFVFMNYVSLE